MDEKKTAASILKEVGGKENVAYLEHCSTRLRFTLRDDQKVNVKALKAIPSVIGVVMTAQCQVVIGPGVVEVYRALCEVGGFGSAASGANESANADGGAPRKKRNFGAIVLDFIVGVFQPLIAAIAGAGVLKSLLLLFNLFGWLDKTDTFYTLFNGIADAAFYFLPLLVAVAAANKLNANRYVALAVVGALLIPSVTSLIGAETGVKIFGFTVQNIAYSYQVFPALLAVLFMAPLERFLTKITPKPIRIFFVPLVTIFITVPVTLLILGPLGYNIGQGFTTIILWLFDKLGFIAVTLLAMVLPFMIATGMHKALVPYAVSSITELGRELLYLPASLAHNISESGACFAAAIRTRDENKRSTAISAGISAAFGITEPALYGVTLQNKRVLTSVVIGSGVGALFLGLFSVESYVAVGPGIASLTAFISETLPRNILYAAIGAGISFVVAFLASMILYRETAEEEEPTTAPEKESAHVGETLASPLTGRIVPLGDVRDETFSAGILGDGIAVLPSIGELYAPADGTVVNVFATGHALTLETENGAELLIHVGLDTVKLGGKYYHPKVSDGDTVKAGDLLLTFDLDEIRAAGYDVVTPVIVSNREHYLLTPAADGEIKHGAPLLELTAAEAGKATRATAKSNA